MFVVAFILGVLVGITLCILVLVLVRKNEDKILHALGAPLNQLGTSNGASAYIAGLSDEEQSFADTLPIDKQVEIL